MVSGCASTPVIIKFPEPPTLLESAPPLTTIPVDTTELSILIDNAAKNYGTYYELKAKYESWIEWYIEQKRVFEEVK